MADGNAAFDLNVRLEEDALREKHRFVTGKDGPSVTGLATVTVIGLQMIV